MDSRDIIRRSAVLVAFTNGSENCAHFVGEAFGYYDQPVYLIRTPAGEATWAASLTREATPEETIAYWRERALKAEGGDDGRAACRSSRPPQAARE